MSTKREVETSIRELARRLQSQATALVEKAEALEGQSEADLATLMGDQYAGPAYFRQLTDEVMEQTSIRVTDHFRRTLTDYFAASQRKGAKA